MRQPIIAIFILFIAITGYYAIPLDDANNETQKNNNNNSTNSSTDIVNVEKKPVIVEGASTSTPISSTTNAPSSSTTEKLVEVKILETSNSSSTSIKVEPSKAPTRTRTTRTTKTPRTRKTTIKPGNELNASNSTSIKQPLTRQDWLKLIQHEMEIYDKKAGNSPISNKNLTIISERILKYLVENGTQIGISLREQKDGTIKYMKGNTTVVDKIYGEGTESKFPPVIEFIVQRIQSYFSVYAYEDHSRPASTEKTTSNELEATVREEKDEDEESSTLTNDQVIDQLEDELTEFISSDVVKNVTDIKLPSLIKTAYEKIQSWFVPSSKPAAKEEPVQESEEESSEATETVGADGKPTKKPSIIKGAYDALEAILSVFDDIDVSDEEEKPEASEKTDAELKESQDDLEETAAIKETVGENLYDFLKLAYTLYDEDES